MKIKEKLGWAGKVTIKTKKGIFVIKNTIMNNALDEIIKALYVSDGPDLNIKHVAIGTSSIANTTSMTALGNEVYRVPCLSKIRSGVGEVTSRAILQDTHPTATLGIVTIEEIGFFAGSESENWNDGDGADTGLLVSRILWNYSKTDDEQIQFTREDNIDRA
jgi:hypothetical protein